MPAISKEQFFAMQYGVLSTSYYQGASPTQTKTKFTAIPGKTILAVGREGLQTATDLVTTNNKVIIAGLNPTNVSVGMPITKLSGIGALNATQGFIGAIVSVDASDGTAGTLVNTRLTVVNSSGTALNNLTAGTLTFVVGGIDLTNNQVPGLGDPTREVFTLANGFSKIGTLFVVLSGGDMNAGGSLSNLEKDYHLTGIGIRKKVK